MKLRHDIRNVNREETRKKPRNRFLKAAVLAGSLLVGGLMLCKAQSAAADNETKARVEQEAKKQDGKGISLFHNLNFFRDRTKPRSEYDDQQLAPFDDIVSPSGLLKEIDPDVRVRSAIGGFTDVSIYQDHGIHESFGIGNAGLTLGDLFMLSYGRKNADGDDALRTLIRPELDITSVRLVYYGSFIGTTKSNLTKEYAFDTSISHALGVGQSLPIADGMLRIRSGAVGGWTYSCYPATGPWRRAGRIRFYDVAGGLSVELKNAGLIYGIVEGYSATPIPYPSGIVYPEGRRPVPADDYWNQHKSGYVDGIRSIEAGIQGRFFGSRLSTTLFMKTGMYDLVRNWPMAEEHVFNEWAAQPYNLFALRADGTVSLNKRIYIEPWLMAGVTTWGGGFISAPVGPVVMLGISLSLPVPPMVNHVYNGHRPVPDMEYHSDEPVLVADYLENQKPLTNIDALKKDFLGVRIKTDY